MKTPEKITMPKGWVTRALSAQDFAKLDEKGKEKLKKDVEDSGGSYDEYEAHAKKMMPRIVSPREIKWRIRPTM